MAWLWEFSSQPNIAWVCSTNERFGWDPIKWSHKSRSIHSLNFIFIVWCVYEYVIYFHLWYYQLFLYSYISNLITTSTMFHITPPWHHSKHSFSCHNCQVMLSLIPNNHVTNIMDLLRNLYPLHVIQVVGEREYFTSQTGCKHTLQDNKWYHGVYNKECIFKLGVWISMVRDICSTFYIKY